MTTERSALREKAPKPMLVTDEGMLTDFSFEQRENASLAMALVPLEMTTCPAKSATHVAQLTHASCPEGAVGAGVGTTGYFWPCGAPGHPWVCWPSPVLAFGLPRAGWDWGTYNLI